MSEKTFTIETEVEVRIPSRTDVPRLEQACRIMWDALKRSTLADETALTIANRCAEALAAVEALDAERERPKVCPRCKALSDIRVGRDILKSERK